MSELDDIKQRATERRKWEYAGGANMYVEDDGEKILDRIHPTELVENLTADLDRAIAIAERRKRNNALLAADIEKNLGEARAAVLSLRDDWLRIAKLNPIRKEQVGQGPMDDVCRFCGGMAPYIPNAEVEHKDCVWALAQRRVADTESYEQYRD